MEEFISPELDPLFPLPLLNEGEPLINEGESLISEGKPLISEVEVPVVMEELVDDEGTQNNNNGTFRTVQNLCGLVFVSNQI